MKVFFTFVKIINRINIIGVIAMVMITAVITIETIARLFRISLFNLDELGGSALIIITFAAVSEAFTQRNHLRIEMVIDRFSKRSRRWVDIFQAVISLGFCVYFSYVLWQMTLSTLHASAKASMSHYLLWPIQVFMPLGMLTLAIAIAAFIVDNLRLLKKKIDV